MTSRPSRLAALAFGAAHTAVCLGGLVDTRVFAPGVVAAERDLRLLSLADLPYAAAVTHAALTNRPLARRLRVGALSDLGRIAALLRLSPRTGGRDVLVGLSALGAVTAASLSTRVDAPVG